MTYRVRKLSTYLRVLDRLGVDDETCYRGQKEPWPILPKVARVQARANIDKDEQRMIAALRQQILQFRSDLPQNDWDLLAIAQHHGMATRLLDWTFNPLAALWFAVHETPTPESNGVIWIFFPRDEDLVTDLDRTSPFSTGRSKLFVPNHVSPRIRAQAGLFSVQKPNRKANAYVPFEKNKYTKDSLECIEIEPAYFKDLRYELDICGINHASMFPDLDGLCRHLTWKHTLMDDEVPE